MITYQQLERGARQSQGGFCWSTALKGCPQVRGKFLKQLIITPRKPNSAKRKVGKVVLSNKKRIVVKIPGKGSRPTKYATVLVRGKGHKDTPGVKYSVIRGARECPSLYKKTRRRSIYGARRLKQVVNEC
jgi:small subunit ribosomal protein S12